MHGFRSGDGSNRLERIVRLLLAALSLLAGNGAVRAQDWSVTELHYQGGNALRDHQVSPSGFQQILTLQHASGWKYGENFFFVDMICCAGSPANRDIYLEWYPYMSLGSVTGKDLSWKRIKDFGPLGGLNWGAQAKFVKIAPGFRVQLDLPGFSFANLDYLYMVDKNQGLAAGGAPGEGNNHLIDFNWALPFEIGGASFSLEGHGEWGGPRSTEFGTRAPHWVLLQPQLRLDIGKALGSQPGRFFAGIEFHVWINKFGFEDADEIIPQILVVLRF